MNPQAPTEVSAVAKGKKRAVQSMGGAMGGALSPKTQARRDAVRFLPFLLAFIESSGLWLMYRNRGNQS
jgi:hypothetical protein